MTHPETTAVARSAAALEERLGVAPRVGVVLGSGLSTVVDRVRGAWRVPYEVLGLPSAGVVGHVGEAVAGALGGVPAVVLSGRVHLYEGYAAGEVVRGVRALHAWGVRVLVLTCSAGGITRSMQAGHLMVLSDHINFQPDNPLVGAHWPAGERFPDMSAVYDPEVREVLKRAAATIGCPLHEGVYAAMMGPGYETPAEIRMLGAVGADAVGMSTVPEALAAAQCGMTVGAIAVISNRAAGLGTGRLRHDDVKDAAGGAAGVLADLLEVALGEI